MAKRKTGAKNKPKNGDKKHGRSKKRALNRGGALSLFVRDKIDGAAYFKATGQARKGLGL